MRDKTYIKYLILFTLTAFIFIAFTGCKKAPNQSASSQSQTQQTQQTPDDQTLPEAGEFVGGEEVKLPLIAWGADLITIYANGNAEKTKTGSLFEKAGFSATLYREDDFNKQVSSYIKGETPFLRGTIGMINMASEKINANPKTAPVVVFQHSWSAGGDALVVKEGIKSVKDLKGKTVAIQSYGPHVDYFMKLITDAGLAPSDINVMWTKDLIGPSGNTPMAKIYNDGVDAAFVIIPDALALTSNGAVGTGAEDSVKGATILLSTKTANRIISDVYVCRKDYYDANKDKVQNFVKALLIAEEQVRDLFSSKDSDTYKTLLQVGGKLLLDDAGASADIEGMYYDAEMAGFNGNIKFLMDDNYPRNCSKLSDEVQSSLIKLGTIKSKSTIQVADFDFNAFKGELRYANAAVPQKFDEEKVKKVAEKITKSSDSSLFEFEIFFKPNQDSFSADYYEDEFFKVIEYASTYGGAIITIEGHSDPMAYLRKKKKGADAIELKKIKQAAKNLSYSRAQSVRDELISFANVKGITLDKSQFTTIGRGIEIPKFKVPETEEEWLANMRVRFRIMQVEAEEDVFKPL